MTASNSVDQTPFARSIATLLLVVFACLPNAALSEIGPRQQAASDTSADPNNARVIVKFRSDSALARVGQAAGRAQHANRLSARMALPLTDGRPLGLHTQGMRGSGMSSLQLAARLASQSDVEWAVVDQRRSISGVIPNDPYYGPKQTSITPQVGQWYLRASDSSALSAINAEGAWATTTGSPNITVAVLDTGVRFDHPDLSSKLWPGYDFVRSSASGDGGGWDADASDPGDWTVQADTCGAAPSSWHGTEVAGLIGAASDNGIGMASVGRNVRLLPVRVLGKCGGFDSDIQAAMLWAAGLSSDPVVNPHPAQVINMSLGSAGNCGPDYQSVFAQLASARVAVVVAAGNAGIALNSPANCAGAIAVAGLRHAGTKVGYSSLGPEVAIAAPAGNCVNDAAPCLYSLLTTRNTGTTTPGANSYSDSYQYTVGTSFSAPLVAGTIALMLSVDPSLTPLQIKAVLQNTARPFPTTGAADASAATCRAPSSTEQLECYCSTSTCGAGMLNAGAAVAQVYQATLLPTAVFTASTLAPVLGATLTLDAGQSLASVGRKITAYRWAITSGAASASFIGATDGKTATLSTTATGEVAISLTVTDDTGASRSTSQSITVTAAVPPSNSSGGGALGVGWLIGLSVAVGLLGRRQRV